MIDTTTIESEAIRIVPLHTSKPALALGDLKVNKGEEHFFSDQANIKAAPPLLVYNGGEIIENVEVFTIFWGNSCANTASY